MALRYEHFRLSTSKLHALILSMSSLDRIYLPCLEVPITTFCSLRCRNCSNLIQYYDQPYHVDSEVLLKSVRKIAGAVDKIDCLRILGGEPLLHPSFDKLIYEMNDISNINNIVIITNGTVLLSKNCIDKLKANKKYKISISKYFCSNNIDTLVDQLKKNDIQYEVRIVSWRDKSNVLFHGYNRKQLRMRFKHCPNHFLSLLNEELHLCPRSAHGIDLGFFKGHTNEFIDLSCCADGVLRKRLRMLLSVPYINACNYCDEPLSDKLRIVTPGVQATKKQMMLLKESMKDYNKKHLKMLDK